MLAGGYFPGRGLYRPNPKRGYHAYGQQRPLSIKLTSLQQRPVKHARCYWLLLAESHLTRRLFASMVRRIELLPSPAG
jgi:hypothetical protein